jgi:hypothetical protein
LEGTSIYATGSVGRLEASAYSDLDVFVISGTLAQDGLGKLQHYELIADLIRTARQNDFPPFSRDGAFLTSHELTDVLGEVGKPEDDYNNRFTARMLLLLESRCLFGSRAYEHAVASVLGRYWPADETEKLPIFLINDLERYWKTLCLNYEGFRRSEDPIGKHHLSLLKLRYSRMWTCFSGLAYLIAGLDGDTIPRSRAVGMVSTNPVNRMLDVAIQAPSTREQVNQLLELYVEFLDFTSTAPSAVVARNLEDSHVWTRLENASDEFGRTMHRLMTRLATATAVERFLLI